MLTKTIDSLFIGIRYGVWVLGILGIIGSVILLVVNLSLGVPSALVFIASLFLSVGVALGLMPEMLVKGDFLSKRYVIALVALILAIVIMGGVYFVSGGFPELNLLFI